MESPDGGYVERVRDPRRDRVERRERLRQWERERAMTGTAGIIRVGCDLGQASDPTAICVAHQIARSEPEYVVRSIERVLLGTSYLAVVDRLATVMEGLRQMNGNRRAAGEPIYAIRLLLDATGLGDPVVDLCRARGLAPIAVTLTGTGRIQWHDARTVSVGKAALIDGLGILMEQRRVTLPGDTDEARVLQDEMRNFRRRTSERTGHVSYNAASGAHDDLIIAAALAIAVGNPPAQGSGVVSTRVVKVRW